MLTGYTADKVSPSGQLEPPSPKDFPNVGSNIIRLKPPTVPMLPFVMLPRPLQESNVVGKGGTAGFLGRAYDPYTLYPPGDDMDMNKMDRIKIDDLQLAPRSVAAPAGAPGPPARRRSTRACPPIDKATAKYDLDEYYGKALGLVISGRARDAFDLASEADAMRERYGRNTFGQSCLLARRLIEAGTRFVEVIWPKVANSDNHSWDVHAGLSQRMKNQAGPMLDAGPVGPDCRSGPARPAGRDAGRGGRRVRPQPAARREHLGQQQQRRRPRSLALLLHGVVAGAGIKRGFVYGKSDKTGFGPLENPVHPRELLATIYHPRHRSGDDRLQPPQPAARAGPRRGRHAAFCLNVVASLREAS